MRLRLGLRMLMAIVAGCALVLAITRSDWVAEWGGYSLVVALVGLVVGGICTLTSFFLLWIVGWIAAWRRHASREPRTDPQFWVWTSCWAIRFYAIWPALLKQAFWSCCAALCLVCLLDQLSSGTWWTEGAPGEIGWRAYTLCSAAIIFAVCATWSRLAPRAAKEDLARMERKWLHGREMRVLYAGIRSTLTWLLITSPAWCRILLAWLLAEVSVPGAHLVIHPGPEVSPSVIVPRFLSVLIVWLLICLAILFRGLYDMSRAFFSWPVAILASVTLSAVHMCAFFGVALSL